MQIFDPFVHHIVTSLQQAGYETYVVGGAVRDLLLKRKPKDYDISTAAEPEQVRAVFGRRNAVIIGRRFRLVHVRNGAQIVEVSTFRRSPNDDSVAPGAAKPPNMLVYDNVYGNSREDAFRRDFTVNALFYDPVTDKLHDFTARGQDDLQARIVRCIGDPRERFQEDPVRMLRALKLVGQYDFTIEKATLDALMQSMALIAHVSPSRLTLELEKILRSPYGVKILRTFKTYGFLKYFLPTLDKFFLTEQTEYALALFRQYNMRLQLQTFRDSASLAIAALALPFVEQKLGGTRGELWKKSTRDVSEVIADQIQKLLMPHAFCQKVTATALSVILMQPYFVQYDGQLERLRQSRAYGRARELCMIQNEVTWRDPALEERFPPETPGFFDKKLPEFVTDDDVPAFMAPKKRRHHRRRYMGKGNPRKRAHADFSPDLQDS